MNTIAVLYQDLGQIDTADYYFRQCLDTWENRAPYISNYFKKDYVGNIISCGRFNVSIKRQDEARKLFEKALAVAREGYEFSRETFAPELVMILDHLAELSKAEGNEAEEKRYREEAESYQK